MTRTRRTITLLFAAAALVAAFAGALALWAGPKAPADDAESSRADAVTPSFEPAVESDELGDEPPTEPSAEPLTHADEAPADAPADDGLAEVADAKADAPQTDAPQADVPQADVQAERLEAPLVGQGRAARAARREDWKPAVLQIVTNFEKADATVNGLPYPEYVPEGEQEGMVLPAGGPHTVEVTYDGKTKTYRLFLRPKEVRILMVELSGFRGGAAAGPTPRPAPRPQAARADDSDEDSEQGRVTVYAKPKGSILIDGAGTGEETPGTVDVEPGRHEVQVKFEDGAESEKKIIRVRKGSRIKLFFRQRN